jgi:hypothetical protein
VVLVLGEMGEVLIERIERVMLAIIKGEVVVVIRTEVSGCHRVAISSTVLSRMEVEQMLEARFLHQGWMNKLVLASRLSFLSMEKAARRMKALRLVMVFRLECKV